MIDRYLLRYFLAVMDSGNFSRAAAQCNVSQPTLSVGIAKLERELGRTLFLRTNRRVELTEAGVQFAGHARRIESEFAAAERSLGGDGAARATVRLGILSTIPADWVFRLATRFAAHLREERVEVSEGREGELLERLRRGRIDMALTLVRSDTRLESEILLTEGYSLAVPAHHPLAHEREVEGDALADNVMIVRRHCEVLAETSRHFTSRGVRPFFTARTTSDERALAMVKAGLGVTVMPDGFASSGVARPKMAGFDHVRNIGVVFGPHFDAGVETAALATLRAVVPGLADN
ncbi:LysR family transcriptional regulator [Sphingomonas sp. G-3-2-10]|uniref:LysR family transcriptional regulator n=1 Tax=Sphingomonas sp. G-3-2-10 TaxID=2728838 RepID=UPI00146B8B51|nr:LysR family transcriptional regulator [Sphingomonas sp. G-3-2-10]NML05710.1 LysR family transcriptional regulator [Sphingomonas sp. G-3-2-10]